MNIHSLQRRTLLSVLPVFCCWECIFTIFLEECGLVDWKRWFLPLQTKVCNSFASISSTLLLMENWHPDADFEVQKVYWGSRPEESVKVQQGEALPRKLRKLLKSHIKNQLRGTQRACWVNICRIGPSDFWKWRWSSHVRGPSRCIRKILVWKNRTSGRRIDRNRLECVQNYVSGTTIATAPIKILKSTSVAKSTSHYSPPTAKDSLTSESAIIVEGYFEFSRWSDFPPRTAQNSGKKSISMRAFLWAAFMKIRIHKYECEYKSDP